MDLKFTPEEEAYRVQLHVTPAHDTDTQMTKVTLLAPVLLILYGCIMPFVMAEVYVIPYQKGTGEILSDGSVNWQTGEAWFALSSALVFIPLGIFAAVMIWRSYHPKARQTVPAE